jgi:HEAT repeat protein
MLLALALSSNGSRVLATGDSGNDVVPLVVSLLTDKDKDVRALGLQQVREEAKGTAPTKEFAALLPNLSPEAQAALLDALSDRADAAARPEVLTTLKSSDESVRAAATHALGSFSDPADIPLLVHSLETTTGLVKAAARDSLVRLRSPKANTEIAASLPQVNAVTRADLLDVLLTRHATDCIPSLLTASQDESSAVRMAAMTALAKLAGPDDVEAMAHSVLKAKHGPEREAAERALVAVCSRITDPARRPAPMLAALAKFDAKDQTMLLSTLGRLGGPDALKIVEAAIADSDSARHDAGLRALCNWPDATIAARLLKLTQTADNPEHRDLTLRALIRVAALHDKRTDAQRLDMLKTAMSLANTDDERNAVIKRARSIRTVESLRFLVPYLDQPVFAQEACASVTELAHHRELRYPNEAEFNKALDIVIPICRDPDVLDHAKRYRKNQT